MGAPATAVRIRHELHTRLLEARARTDELFRVVRDEAMYDRPIPERHRIIFYVGHVEAFDWNLLALRAFGLRSTHRTFDQLFGFGIELYLWRWTHVPYTWWVTIGTCVTFSVGWTASAVFRTRAAKYPA